MRKAALKMQYTKTKSFDVSSFLLKAQSRPSTLQLIIFKRKGVLYVTSTPVTILTEEMIDQKSFVSSLASIISKLYFYSHQIHEKEASP